MGAQLINGQSLAENILTNVATAVGQSRTKPKLVSIVIGHDLKSHKFVDLKEKNAHSVGINFEKKTYPNNFDPRMVMEYVHEKNADPSVHGIMIQLPLPKEYSRHQLLKKIHPFKDVDCLHPKNLGLLLEGHPTFISPVVLAVLDTISTTKKYPTLPFKTHFQDLPLPNLTAVPITVIGSGFLVGKPLFAMLTNLGATVTVVNEHTLNIGNFTRVSEIVITGTNQSNVIQPTDITNGSVLIDVGHDFDANKFLDLDIFLSKTPGGVGPLTVAHLLQNTFLASQNNLPQD